MFDADPGQDLAAAVGEGAANYFVLVYNFYGNQPVVVHQNVPDGTLFDITVADLGEPDGKPEIILADVEFAEVRVFEQAMNVYVEVASVVVGGSPIEVTSVALRGGGSPDMISLNGLSGAVSVVATIHGGLDPVLDLEPFEPGVYVSGMAVADFDNDGFQDIAVVEPQGQVAVFRNQSGD